MRYRNVFITLTMQYIISTLASAFKDPFQPVWDSLDQFPTQMLDQIQLKMNDHAQEVNSAIDQKIQLLKTDMTSLKTQQTPDDEDDDNAKDLMTDALKIGFENFYNTKMKGENEAAILYNDENTMVLLEEVETKVRRHLDQMLQKKDLLFRFDSYLEDHVYEINQKAQILSAGIDEIDSDVASVREKLLSEEQGGCASTSQDIELFVQEKQPSEQRLHEFEREWDDTYHAVVGDLPKVFFNRDCSDILWSNPDALSGLYDIHPTHDLKKKVSVWCDMETPKGDSDVAGWTVMLRRRNTSEGFQNFNRSWEEYSAGFGIAGEEGEWWLGLTWIHQLTYYQPYQVLFILHDIEKGDYQAHYSTFRVEDEKHNFRLIVDGFTGLTGEMSDAFIEKHHGQPFSTPDIDNDGCESCNCAVNNQGGWWYNICHRTVLTAPFPTSSDRNAKTIRWLSEDEWLVLDDVTMMIKPTSFH